MTDRERLEEIKSRVWKDKGTYAMGDYSQREGYIYTLSDYDYEWLVKQAERVEELENKVQRYEQKFEEILELGWTENFGGSYVNMGEYHADAIQIAESALGRSKRND